jgi:hypothetical protein
MPKPSKGHFTSKKLAYMVIMAALGTALAILSIELPLAPHQITLDLSHIGTFLAAIPGGAIFGLITGALVGIYPGFAYGFTHGSMGVIGLITLPIGKAMTGCLCGAIQRFVKRPLVTVTISYVPECFYTIWLFIFVIPPLTGWPVDLAFLYVIGISVKAWIEILFMAFLMESIFLSRGIVQLVQGIFPEWDYTPLSDM